MKTLRLIAVTLLTVPVGAIMLAAGTVVIAFTLCQRPFYWIRNTANWFLEGLLLELSELWGPGE